jgi:succinoglycan biosynthesis transport protein ExoP
VLNRLGWGAAPPNSDAERAGEAMAAVSGNLDVKRIGPSYLFAINFRSSNPDQAAKIANAVIDGYIFDQLNAKYQANRRAGDWLQERLQALREQAAAAERAVVEFKAKNNIVAAGGTLMNEKQLTEISSQLASARAQGSDVQARLDRIRAVRKAYQQDYPASATDESVAEAMNSAIINSLRTKYLDYINREAEWSVKYGKNHTAVVNLRNQIRDIRRSIADELGRIEETTKSESEISKKRQEELEKSLGGLISQSTATNQAQITLFSLEASAQSYRKLYDDFLRKHTESVQQQTFPISDARSVSPAVAVQTYPKPLLTWFAAIFGGAVLGIGCGALREMLDRGFRTREQVRSVLNTQCLALVPRLTDRVSSRSAFPSLPFMSRKAESLPFTSRKAEFASSLARQLTGEALSPTQSVLWTAVDSPSSPYAEAIRTIKLTLDLERQTNSSKVIGLTSCLASEGKSTVAAGLATLIGQSGASVILVDCDVRNPSLSRTLARDAKIGFLDVVAGKASLSDALYEAFWKDHSTSMTFLPTVLNPDLPNPTELLASDAARKLVTSLASSYDYVIVDLAPLISAIDVRAASRVVDSYLLVIEWGATKVDAVQYALRNLPGVQENIAGVVLNKVDLNSLRRYDSYGADYYYDRSGRAA